MLTGYGHGGSAVGRADGLVVFAAFGIPGERVEVALDRRRRRFAEGRVVRVDEPSPDRVTPPCPHYGACGGCQLQHVRYERQLELKREVVVELLDRIGGFRETEVRPVVPSPRTYGYRNSALLRSNARGEIGYTTVRGDAFLRVDTCPIMDPPVNEALAALQGGGTPSEHVRVRHSAATGETLVWPQVLSSPSETGRSSTRHRLLGAWFRVSATSFFQVNTPQAENLVRYAVGQLGALGGATVLELYAGVGAFTRSIAEAAARVIGIEESASAVADARVNLAGLPVRLIEGRVERSLAALRTPVDLALLDPPRGGCGRGTPQALRELAPRRIVYVSCDPATLARDLRLLGADGAYRLAVVQPFDMFPQTHHIETVATLVSR